MKHAGGDSSDNSSWRHVLRYNRTRVGSHNQRLCRHHCFTLCIVYKAIATAVTAAIIGSLSLGGGSRKANIPTIIQTAYDMVSPSEIRLSP
jgi:hypothetical protein